MLRFSFCPTTSTDQGSPVSYNYYHILQYLLEQTALLNGDVCVDIEIYISTFAWYSSSRKQKKYLNFLLILSDDKRLKMFLKMFRIIFCLPTWIDWSPGLERLLKLFFSKSWQKTFSNFSCMFLNPNNFFQFEFLLF